MKTANKKTKVTQSLINDLIKVNLTVNNVVILSACKSFLSNELNAQRTQRLIDSLTDLGINFLVGLGMYKGDIETAIVCFVEDSTELSIVENLAFKQFEQESIVLSNFASNTGILKEYNGKKTTLGQLTELHELTALPDGFTQIGTFKFSYC